MRVGRVAVGALAFLWSVLAFAQLAREQVRARGDGRETPGREVSFRGSADDADAAPIPIFGAIETVASGSPAVPQTVFGRKEDVFLAGGPATTPCFFPAYLPDGKYYFQVTDATGAILLSTDVVSERAVTVKGGVISSYDGKTHSVDGKTACGSLAVNLMPFADAGPRQAAYVVWLTNTANFEGSISAVDNPCGGNCSHGFHTDLSRAFGFRVEDKTSCEATFCVSGVKFNDANGNGVRDSGEAGLPGVVISVAGNNGVVLSALTGPDGSFQICGLTDGGAFRVFETVPNGFSATGPGDRDISRRLFARGGAYIIDLCDEDLTGLDFANQAIPNAIGGFKFEDLNANGARDPGEPGLAGVTIRLTLSSDPPPPPRTTVTDVNGNFLFTSVTPGNYVLTEIVPSGFTQTVPASDGIPVTLAAGGSSLNNVFGNFHGILTGSISGAKFEDLNGNGVRDPGEGGLAGVTITLSSTTQPSRTVVTAADGSFTFTGVPFGTYTVSETPPANYVQTAPPAPGTLTATLDFGHQTVTGLLIGNRAVPGSIAGTKFNDLNGNGARDAGEPGFSGVTIQLKNAAGTIVTAATDASGNFSFLGLQPGTFTLSEIVPSGFKQTAPAAPGTFSITIAPAQNATGFLFGNQSTAAATGSIAGTKFNDLNGNGVRDPGEPPLAGVTIQLKNAAGQTTTSTTTAAGDFSFPGLAAGTYTLSEVVPPGFKQTAPAAPGTISVTLVAGQAVTGLLFGNQAISQPGTGSISGIKILDLDSNGVVNGIDRPLEGIVIVLTDSSGATRKVTTGANGTFTFTNLPAGTYVLSEELPPNFFQTFPGTPAKPGTFTITLAPGQNATGFQFLNKC